MPSPDGLTTRIAREAGVPDLVDALARLAPTDLQSLLIAVHARHAAAVTPPRLLERYEANRFVRPSPADPRRFGDVERVAWSLLPAGYAPIELSPLAPLGACSAVATVSQNKIVSTDRTTEVVSDCTNVLALECASRRRRARGDAATRHAPVLLATSQRLVRTPLYRGPRSFAHFRVLALCSAGRDASGFRFEADRVTEHLDFYLRLLRGVSEIGRTLTTPRVAVTDVTDGRLAPVIEARVLRPLAERFPEARVHLDPSRTAGRGYYEGVCFKLYATDPSTGSGQAAGEIELADGGPVPWTRRLLSDDGERLVISGLGMERLCLGPDGTSNW